ncbi:hypothetical protein HDU78_011828 [Chytriomyces hyalinus]|nr:hypothetical protein HDU78_011828 [Chytriomyces hyalinus]
MQAFHRDPGTRLQQRDILARAIRSNGDASFPHSRSLKAHTGCVNAIAFDGTGQYLASGGDDCVVLIWDTHRSYKESPVARFKGHLSNIFSIAFTSNNEFLYSGANDGLLLKYDMNQGVSLYNTASASRNAGVGPVDIVEADEHSVLKVAIQPENDNIVLTCGQGGSISLWDFRCRTNQCEQGSIVGVTSVNCVAFNPAMPNLFLSCDDFGNIILRDMRMAFKSRGETTVEINGEGGIRTFVTTLAEVHSPFQSNPLDITSLAFSPCGSMFASTSQKWRPTLYSLQDPFPICTFKSKVDGIQFPRSDSAPAASAMAGAFVEGYSSACTIKSGAFGDAHAGGYLAGHTEEDASFPSSGYVFGVGSDDQRAYVWHVPSAAWLLDRRLDVEGAFCLGNHEASRTVANTDVLGNKKIPFQVDEELFALQDHRSIVNSIAFNPKSPVIATAGVEKVVRLFSPFPYEDYDEDLDNKRDTVSRKRISQSRRTPNHETTEEDISILSEFDRIVGRERLRNTVWEQVDSSDSDSDATMSTDTSSTASSSLMSHSFSTSLSSASSDISIDEADIGSENSWATTDDEGIVSE